MHVLRRILQCSQTSIVVLCRVNWHSLQMQSISWWWSMGISSISNDCGNLKTPTSSTQLTCQRRQPEEKMRGSLVFSNLGHHLQGLRYTHSMWTHS